MNLATAFVQSAEKNSTKPALFYGEAEFSHADILGQSLAVATHLREKLCVKPGDRVGIWLKNCPEFVFSLFGILLADAVVVPINNFLKPDEVDYIIADAGINILISDSEMSEGLAALKAKRPELEVFIVAESIAEQTTHRPSPIAHRLFSDLAVIIYTSGTTGRPKGAMLSHGNLLHNVESCRQVLQIVEHDRLAVILPLFHSFMLTVGTLLPLLVGGSIVLIRSLHPMKNVLQEICDRQATVLPAIPQFYRSMASASVPANFPLRLFISGAAPLPVQILHDFEAKFGIPLIEGYGLSEASPVVTKNPLDGTRKPGSIGLPIPNVEVSVQDDSGKILDVSEVGEICVRGGNVMLGYWNKPDETANAMRGDWLLTGDIGYRDEQGYYFITDRKKDMLLVNGINVYPREIEEILYQFPGVKEAAVIGVPDKRKGEQAVAYIAANDGVTLEERAVAEFIRARLADYKVPRKIFFLSKLPRNATGKILKTELKRMSAETDSKVDSVVG